MRDESSRHAWESVKPPPDPFYLTTEAYRDCRRARPDVDWTGFEARLDIQIRPSTEGRRLVMVLEDTLAADAIREALTHTLDQGGSVTR